MEGIEHRTVNVNGINMHMAEKGEGPVILFLHGFPELWYSWRHQIVALAPLGYRAVALDLRGYGDTDAPASPASYTSLHVVVDLAALLDAIAADQDKVFVVAHDWGAIIAWYLCLYRPDKVKALVNLSVAFTPRNPKRKPLESLRALYGDDYYICRFQVLFQSSYKNYSPFSLFVNTPNSVFNTIQEPGEIEADFAQIGTTRVLKEFLTYRNPGPLYLRMHQSSCPLGSRRKTLIIMPPNMRKQASLGV